MEEKVKQSLLSIAVDLASHTGRIPEEFASILLEEADRCGYEAVKAKSEFLISSGKLASSRAPASYLRACLKQLPPSSKAASPSDAKPAEANSIQKEIESEEAEIREIERKRRDFPSMYRQKWSEPNDPHFDESPSVFDGPYQGHEEYRANTFISVKREADAEHVSMHEICRRKGLRYEHLLF